MNIKDLILYPEQERVLEELKEKRSALIVAPTGSGKTLIALGVMLYLFEKGYKRILFIAPTNLLVEQHTKAFSEYYDKVFKLSSKDSSFLNFEGICVSTAHLAEIRTRALSPDHYDALIFDECHKALSLKSPYCLLANRFKTITYGFTASPGSTKNVKKILSNLSLSSLIEGSSPFNFKRDVNKIILTNTTIIQQTYNTFLSKLRTRYPMLFELFYSNKINYISNMIKSKETLLKKIKEYHISDFQYYCFFYQMYALYLYYFESHKTCTNYLSKKNKPFLSKWCEELIKKESVNQKYEYLLKELIPSEESMILIFFENYDTAKDFKEKLLEHGYRADQVVLLAGKSKITPKNRNLLIQQTYAESTKVILATSVIEEGINVKGVDRVVFYTPISNSIRYLQRIGRTGRYRDGNIYILCYDNTHEVYFKF